MRLNGVLNVMVDATISLLNYWESIVEREGGILEIIVNEDLRSLSADIISRACFSSNYSKGGRNIFKAKSTPNGHVKGKHRDPRYLPSKEQREMKIGERLSLILKVVKQRIEEAIHEKDLLQKILDGAKTCDDYKGQSKERFIVDNYKLQLLGP
ncbi:hypothetical protein CRYUN_Cryun14cG0009300 [Craigia yunnanensis]